METLEIEDLKYLIESLDYELCDPFINEGREKSIRKSRAIIEQMIKDREFEQSQTTLPKL